MRVAGTALRFASYDCKKVAGFGFTKMMYDGSKRCLDSGLHGVDAFFLLDEDLCAGVDEIALFCTFIVKRAKTTKDDRFLRWHAHIVEGDRTDEGGITPRGSAIQRFTDPLEQAQCLPAS